MVKKILVSVFILSLFISSNVWASSASDLPDPYAEKDIPSLEAEIPLEVRQAMENQIDALYSYQKLYDSFGKDDVGLPIYPDEYAGAYIEDGNLIIQLTDNNATMRNKYLQICQTDLKIDFKEAVYSLNDLLVYEDYAIDLYKEGYNVVAFGVIEKENVFEICMDANEAEMAEVNSMLNRSTYSVGNSADAPVKFSYQEKPEACAAIFGGDGLVNETTGATFTAGICGTYNGQDAILTCGHGNTPYLSYDYVKYLNTRIGRFSYHRCNSSENATGVDTLGDFAIISLNDNATTTNRIYGDVCVTGTFSSIPEGTTIYKYGTATQLSYGTVLQASIGTIVSFTGRSDSSTAYFVRGLYKHYVHKADGTNAADYGDSGGPVYIKDGSQYLLHGTVSAMVKNGGIVNVMYSSPVFYATDVGFSVKVD